MTDNVRLIVNTLAQNVRTILNIILSLYSTRIVIQALGQADYGIYMLVAGIVSLLSYISNTLVITTQRHLSYSAGSGKIQDAKLIFANSYMLHWLIGLMLGGVCIGMTSMIFDSDFLNIEPGKVYESKIVYFFVVVSVLLTFITSPFKSLLVAHENIVYISIIDVLDGVLKLSLVFCLYFIDEFRLAMYAAIMASIMLFHFVMLAVYSRFNYEECILIPRLRLWSNTIQRQIIGFATWTLYGMMCVYVRTQGAAVVVNRALGTVANAALGIATQLYGSIQFLSQALLNAISPQIIKAEGAHDRKRALKLSMMASKYSFLVMSMLSIPLCVEVPSILRIWLADYPDHTVTFCRMMLISSLIDQITTGLGTMNQAVGKIRNYTLVTYTIKIVTIPASLLLLRQGYGVYSIVISYILFELLSALVRIPLLVRTTDMNAMEYIKSVILRIIPPAIVMTCASIFIATVVPCYIWRFLLTGVASSVMGGATILCFAMTQHERSFLISIIQKKMYRK